ncbi:MAG TPA: carboxypeptidase regulatory-like domain-containing protein [Opitutaceae bacterium]|nr:carboxypeptidase regulatory-like domain-containing protein [Opitutaceae bacterium]
MPHSFLPCLVLRLCLALAASLAVPLVRGQVVNTSVRVQVGTGANILITGFVIGPVPKTFLFRAGGPVLTGFGVPGVLADPELKVFSGSTVIASNNDWGVGAGATAIADAAAGNGAFAFPSGSKDAALIVSLPSGPYTIQIAGADGGSGIALFEAYDITPATPTPPPPTTGSGTLRGLVRDGSTSTPLGGVTLVFSSATGVALGNTTTSNTGEYSLTLPAGAVTATVNFNGYVSTSLNATVVANSTVQVDSVLFARNQPGNGTVSGRIANALTGAGLSGATLRFRTGVGTTSGTVVGTATTDSSGNYTVQLPSGTYSAEIALTGYVTTYFVTVAVGGSTIANQNSSISPVLAGNDLRIVLTWGQTPSDLDSHFTGPNAAGTARFHVYYSSRAATGVNLDVDDTSSFGPETVTVSQFNAGTYRYSVHDFSNGSSTTSTVMSNTSGAQVRVFQGSNQVATFNVPSGRTGNLWTVFEMDGASRIITPINTITNVAGPSSIQSLPADAVVDGEVFATIVREGQSK